MYSGCNDFGFKGFRKINFLRLFPCKCIWIQNLTLTLNRPRSNSYHHLNNWVGYTSQILLTKSECHLPSCSGEEDFKGFYHIWAWRPSWSCDQNHLRKFSFPRRKKSSHTVQQKMFSPDMVHAIFRSADYYAFNI